MIKERAIAVFPFTDCEVRCLFEVPFAEVSAHIDAKRIVYVTDENIYQKYPDQFPIGHTIVLPQGEEHKHIETVMKAIEELQLMEADRETFILGVGGGVVTDVSGFLASIYLRGIRFAFAPTSILAMVDAAVGGKNGVNAGLIKNQVGVIRQPAFLFYDYQFLNSLPDLEWVSGFAEIIKHACIKDADMFQLLMNNSLEDYRKDLKFTGDLIRRNAEIKFDIVCNDETETGQRRLLNFGHTIGHAVENILKLPHGFAISIGMKYACKISERLAGFPSEKTEKILSLLRKYHLPVEANFDKESAWNVLVHDKKKSGDHLHFILLEDIGKGVVQKVSLPELKNIFFEL